MPIENIMSQCKYVNTRKIMYKKVLDTWDYDYLNEMLGTFRSISPIYRDLHFLFSNDLNHVYFIAENTYAEKYNNAWENNEKLLLSLVKDNNYNLEKVAKILGIKPFDVYNAITLPDVLNNLLPTLLVEDIIEKRQAND